MAEFACYPKPNKKKAAIVLEAFAAGARAIGATAEIFATPPDRLAPGVAVFYGVPPMLRHLWAETLSTGREYYYIDNAYFDSGRNEYYRVTKNAMQVDGHGEPDYDRMAALEISIAPWSKTGSHIVVCPQSDDFMDLVGYPGPRWMRDVLKALRGGRKIIVRPWGPGKNAMQKTLALDLQGAWALVTHASAAANEAVLAGIPVFVTGKCATIPIASTDLSMIEKPNRPEGRERWAASLAAQQWTLAEIASGAALGTLRDA